MFIETIFELSIQISNCVDCLLVVEMAVRQGTLFFDSTQWRLAYKQKRIRFRHLLSTLPDLWGVLLQQLGFICFLGGEDTSLHQRNVKDHKVFTLLK